MEFIILFAGQGGGGGIQTFLPFALIMVVIYFLMIRPQSKRQKEKQQMLADLKKGDNIVTIGGIHGTVAGFKNKGKVVQLKLDKNTSVTLNRTAIAGLREKVGDDETASIEEKT
ncbi:MAG: preprotein translocase subunit YajC [Candidatus Neomarinimicrobiota bacterium]